MRQEEFADRSQVQGRTATDCAHDLHARALAEGALDIDDLVALAHREIHGLVRQAMQFAHGCDGGFAYIEPRLDQIAQFQQAHAQTVAAGFGAVDETAQREVVENAVRRRRVQAGSLADCLE